MSVQEAARDLRYEWFFELLSNKQYATAKWILTAHHADDNVETILMNFFRGTGLHGMTGIPVEGSIGSFSLQTFFVLRPLLPFFKNELLDFAKENQLEFVEDSSNLSSKYTRNYFRNEIIPAISKVYPQTKENLVDNINRFKEIEKLYKISTGEIIKKVCRQKDEEIHIPIKQLIGYESKALIYEIISRYGFSEKQVVEVLKLAEGDSGSYIDSAHDHFRIIKHRHWFIITPILSQYAENIIIDEKNSKINFSGGTVVLEKTGNQQPVTTNYTACLDAKEITFPLLLRKWKTGDYFYPLGMRKKKKLARFFIDQKLSKTQKEKVWVIEMNKKIIWVVGYRIDDRFKITPATTKVLKMTLHI
jgi:tRNA(Ile)-lysidine synthase